MSRIFEALRQKGYIALSGPYGTIVAEKFSKKVWNNPLITPDFPVFPEIDHGCSALLTEEGKNSYLLPIALEYARSIPQDRGLILVTPSFRLGKPNLDAAGNDLDLHLSSSGGKLLKSSLDVAAKALAEAKRQKDNSYIAATVGPPFDCYCGELTPDGVQYLYLPQVFTSLRVDNGIDYVLFETVPSLKAAKGAALSYQLAHGEFDLKNSQAAHITDVKVYLRKILPFLDALGAHNEVISMSTYDPLSQSFARIEAPKNGYVISLCLEKDATLNHAPLDTAIKDLYNFIGESEIEPPLGLGLNCNSINVTQNALRSLEPESLEKIVSIHPNASTQDDPREYHKMTRQSAIPHREFAERVSLIAKEFGIRIVGGCCGTEHETMRLLHEFMK